MIVTLIIGLLGSISIPFYFQYMAEVKANSLYSEASNYKIPIAICFMKNNGNLENCDADKSNIPPIKEPVLSIIDGVIKVDFGDLDGDSVLEIFELKPTSYNSLLHWEVNNISGSDVCKLKGGWIQCL